MKCIEVILNTFTVNYIQRKAAWLLFLFYATSAAAQVSLWQNDSLVSFIASSGEHLIQFNKQQLITAQSFNEKIKPFSIEKSEQKHFTHCRIDSIYQYDNSYFFTGFIAQKFPFELGIFFDTQKEKKIWLSAKVTDEDTEINTLQLHFKTDAKHIWGGGERALTSDLTVNFFDGLVQENNLSKSIDKNISQLPIPRFCTEKNFCFEIKPTECTLYFDTSGNITLHIFPYRKNDYWLFNVEFDEAGIFNVPQQDSLPDWAYGTILSVHGNYKKIDKAVAQSQKMGYSVTAIYLHDLSNKKNRTEWERRISGSLNLQEWVKKMNEKGIHVLAYATPFLSKKSKYLTEAKLRNYLVQDSKGKWYLQKIGGKPAYLIDLYKPAVANWLKQLIKKKLLENNFSGWMADLGGNYPLDAKLPEGFSPRSAHNFYPVVWARINREALQESSKDDSMLVLHRSGTTGSLRYSKAFWTNAQTHDLSNEANLQAIIKTFLNMAVTGAPYLQMEMDRSWNTQTKSIKHSDIFYRWIEFIAFTPFFKISDENIMSNRDEYTKKFIARFAQIHALFKNYFKEAASEKMLIQPLFFSFYSEEEKKFQYEFLVGKDLLVAPTAKNKQSFIEVKFPTGKWRNIFDESSKEYSTFQIEKIKCAPGFPAVFVRIGSQLDKWIETNKIYFVN